MIRYLIHLHIHCFVFVARQYLVRVKSRLRIFPAERQHILPSSILSATRNLQTTENSSSSYQPCSSQSDQDTACYQDQRSTWHPFEKSLTLYRPKSPPSKICLISGFWNNFVQFLLWAFPRETTLQYWILFQDEARIQGLVMQRARNLL